MKKTWSFNRGVVLAFSSIYFFCYIYIFLYLFFFFFCFVFEFGTQTIILIIVYLEIRSDFTCTPMEYFVLVYCGNSEVHIFIVRKVKGTGGNWEWCVHFLNGTFSSGLCCFRVLSNSTISLFLWVFGESLEPGDCYPLGCISWKEKSAEVFEYPFLYLR